MIKIYDTMTRSLREFVPIEEGKVRMYVCGPTVRKGVLISAHAQVIGPVEIGENAKVGAAAVVVADVPSDVTVVGIPA